LTLAAGEQGTVTIPCAFEPQKLVVDPDACVMQLERQKATVDLRSRPGGSTLAGRPPAGTALRN